MTAEEHNKYLGIAHLIYGVVHVLLMIVMGAFVLGMMGMMTLNQARTNGPPLSFMAVIMVFAVVINVLLAIPSFIAGYGFLKRKSWAKLAGIVAAVLSALRVPFGTAVSIYTFWFLFSTPGKVLYDHGAQVLPPAPPLDWRPIERSQRQETYVPPKSPPDWR